LYNAGIIFGLLFFVPHYGIIGLGYGTVVGALLHLAIRTPAVVRWGYRPHIDYTFSSHMRQTLLLMLPKMFHIGAWQILLWWYTRLATTLEDGSVTMYNLARNVQSLPVSLIGISLSLGAFSTLTTYASQQSFSEFRGEFRKTLLLISVLSTLSAIALAIVSHLLISLLFGGGNFTQRDVAMTASVLAVYCASIPLESVMHLFARAHYALKDTLRPSGIQIMSIILTVVCSALLVDRLGLYVIPVSFTLGMSTQVLLLWISLRRTLRITQAKIGQ
jgi:putative peptidoglycan lipid II flippase